MTTIQAQVNSLDHPELFETLPGGAHYHQVEVIPGANMPRIRHAEGIASIVYHRGTMRCSKCRIDFAPAYRKLQEILSKAV